MMAPIAPSRRQFLSHVGRGMLLASLGPAVAYDLALASPPGDEEGRLEFGALEPLVALMQETPAAKLQPILVERLRAGTDLKTIVAAAALANARTFGGEDYDGYHCAMAMIPAYEMAQELDGPARALPVLKVVYRNTDRMQDVGGSRKEVLREVAAAEASFDEKALRNAARECDVRAAETGFAAIAGNGAAAAWDALQASVRDDINVHRTVLAWRAWDLLRLTGMEHAHTMLRQNVRFFVYEEDQRVRRGQPEPAVRQVVPALLEKHGLAEGVVRGTKHASDDQVAGWAKVIALCSREDGAACAAEALAQGYSAEDVGEAISLAANTLLLCDPGRASAAGRGRQKGSVHGASVGVHASDAARAWRSIAASTEPRHAAASLVTAAFHTAGQSEYVRREPVAYAEKVKELEGRGREGALAALRKAIDAGDQMGACAAAACYGDLEGPARAIFSLLLDYAVRQDGALHAEKYYRTTSEEFEASRPAFRWRQVVALARVTASQQGDEAPGVEEARRLLVG